eukprot:CAMPEP_0115487082 /NCGR_PEP_ID=MMETSP0271-20121206/60768_1 /TAXON_ID=71861 /ORGANISM="Scrippsiella trochoidea, Strain CCMP3099" /LENGTH=41 /DNA_ID= /DNA_START= /DNA_END= /DNA_ORIENTATION=
MLFVRKLLPSNVPGAECNGGKPISFGSPKWMKVFFSGKASV